MTTYTYRIEINEGGAFRQVLQIDGDDAPGGAVRAHLAEELRHWRRVMRQRPFYGRPRVRLLYAPTSSGLL